MPQRLKKPIGGESRPPTRHERILVVDDDVSLAETVRQLLNADGYEVVLAHSAQECWELYNSEEFNLIVSDLRLPDADGIELTRWISNADVQVPIIIMTSYSSVESAVSALRSGAVDYVIKPFDNDDFRMSIERALNEKRLRTENAALKRSLQKNYSGSGLIGESEGIKELHRMIDKVAPSDANVLIQGESGTGKELVAQRLHWTSHRADGPFVPLNCGAIPSSLVESELFGHAKGAYTGAVSSSEGLIREAQGGTLFLDEIATLDLDLQVKLLRVIQERQVRPVGGNRAFSVDVRIVAATNQDLKEALEQGVFREDLYYRLNVINMRVPPLRERQGDVDLLADHYLTQYSKQFGRDIRGMTDEMRGFIRRYHWPGNVRELQNFIERAVILAEGDTVTLQSATDSGMEIKEGLVEDALSRKLSLEEYAQEFVRRYQEQHNETELASMLGIGRKALWMRRNRWGLHRSQSAGQSSVS